MDIQLQQTIHLLIEYPRICQKDSKDITADNIEEKLKFPIILF